MYPDYLYTKVAFVTLMDEYYIGKQSLPMAAQQVSRARVAARIGAVIGASVIG